MGAIQNYRMLSYQEALNEAAFFSIEGCVLFFYLKIRHDKSF
jgi:hypothetical protein